MSAKTPFFAPVHSTRERVPKSFTFGSLEITTDN